MAAGAVDREFVYIELMGAPKHATPLPLSLSLSCNAQCINTTIAITAITAITTLNPV